MSENEPRYNYTTRVTAKSYQPTLHRRESTAMTTEHQLETHHEYFLKEDPAFDLHLSSAPIDADMTLHVRRDLSA